MASKIYCGRGNHISYTDLMDLINLSFNCTTPETMLDGLLPKCYREQYHPQKQNYVIAEDETLVAAVGAYDHEIIVCGRHLHCRGVGNVAVHPNHRSKGYMKLAMNKALDDMIQDGVILSTLAGQRQRYQYFGYENAGVQISFRISPENIRHLYGSISSPYIPKLVTDSKDENIDDILRITERKAYVPFRPRDKYLDVAHSWKAKLLTFSDPSNENSFVGYCIVNGSDTITEVGVNHAENLTGIIRSVFDYLKKGFTINIPAYDAESIAILSPIAEKSSLGTAMMYNIFNYEAAIDAFMALKLSYTKMSDGELTLLIHGFAGDEALRVAVKDGVHTVTQIPNDVFIDLELDHLHAIDLLFSPVSAIREEQSNLVKSWFPLPIWMYSADGV